MLRLNTPDFHRLATASALEVHFGGAEANVAVQIAQLGGSAAFVTRLPDNPLADRCLAELRGLGVKVEHVVRGGDRMGLYFLEQGASQRATSVVYDRQHSAISEAKAKMFDWESILAQAHWFHCSGITPALSKDAADACLKACVAARKLGLTVSFDVNFRSKLWSREEAAKSLKPFLSEIDVCVCGEDDAVNILGATPAQGEEEKRLPTIAADLAKRHSFRTVAMTARSGQSAQQTSWRGMLYDGAQAFFSRRHEIAVVDRVGAGDSFTGALIYSLLQKAAPQAAIEFAIAASTLKHTIPGDYNRVSLAEVEALAAGGDGGRVAR